MAWKKTTLTQKIAAAATVASSLVAANIHPAQADVIESPDYAVIESSDGYELRKYAPYIVAETTVEAENQREAASKAFMTLAGYIFGANQARDKIAMTSPVTTQKAGEKIAMTSPVTSQATETGEYVIQFSMPSKWTMETLPVPLNKAVSLREVSARTMAAYSYTGERTEDQRQKMAAQLSDWVEEKGWFVDGPPVWAGYDGPSVPREKRRFEVMLPVAESQSG